MLGKLDNHLKKMKLTYYITLFRKLTQNGLKP